MAISELIYQQLAKEEDIIVQNYNNGIHSKRQPLGTIRHNHRKVAISELVFDIDCHNLELSKEIEQFISNNLTKDDISHSVWWTSKSYHIHAFFTDFKNYDEETRKALKKYMLKHYSKHFNIWLDYGVCSSKRTIRDFETMHEVTKKPKKLVYWYNQDKPLLNTINPEILRLFWQSYKSLNPALNIKISPITSLAEPIVKAYKDFIAFACKTEFKKQGMQKNNLYFKNIVIAVYLLNLSKEETEQIFKQVAMNCKPHKVLELQGWYNWAKKQKNILNVNFSEIGVFYKK